MRPTDRLDALATWFEAEYLSLARFATALCGDRSAAEDIVQEAFVRTYAAGATIEPGFRSYVLRTILNIVRSSARRASAERHALARVGDPQAVPAPAEPDDVVWGALRQLAPKQRAVLTLRYYEDLSEREIAQALRISPGAVKKHASRGLGRLRKALGDPDA